MKNLSRNLILPNKTLKEALKKMEETFYKCLIVVNKSNKLLGTITDGDIRRAIIRGAKFSSILKNYYYKKPFFVNEKIFSGKLSLIKKNLELKDLDLVPIIDKNKKVINIKSKSEIFKETKHKIQSVLKSIPVVIMAGGRGTRLLPHTSTIPKPLMPIDNKSMIEHVMDKFIYFGSKLFFITINYKKELVKAFFSINDKKIKIKLITEKKPLGTAGSLSLIKKKIKSTFFVINCDAYISCNYKSLYEFHKKNKSILTVVVSKKNNSIPYGVCKVNSKGLLASIKEKPSIDFLANTGLYVMEPSIINFIKKNSFFDMNQLIDLLLKKKKKISIFPINEDEWIDLGNWNSLKKFTN
tara:strand:+ start:129 stop:1190 length:1062 start_codon:yes stop_codon:yes gene_type:complete